MQDYTLTKLKDEKNFPDGVWELKSPYGSARIFAEPKKNGKTNYHAIIHAPDCLWVTEHDALDLNKLAERVAEELQTTGLDLAVERAKEQAIAIAQKINDLQACLTAANNRHIRLLELRIRRDANANK